MCCNIGCRGKPNIYTRYTKYHVQRIFSLSQTANTFRRMDYNFTIFGLIQGPACAILADKSANSLLGYCTSCVLELSNLKQAEGSEAVG